ncbi:MAG: hypothetical protein ACOZBH_03090 [Patescibacteria group bacterium]
MKSISRIRIGVNGRRYYFSKMTKIDFEKDTENIVLCKIRDRTWGRGNTKEESFHNARAAIARGYELSRKPAHLCDDNELEIRSRIFGLIDLIAMGKDNAPACCWVAGELIKHDGLFYFKPISSDYGGAKWHISRRLAAQSRLFGQYFRAKFKADRAGRPTGMAIEVQSPLPKGTNFSKY